MRVQYVSTSQACLQNIGNALRKGSKTVPRKTCQRSLPRADRLIGHTKIRSCMCSVACNDTTSRDCWCSPSVIGTTKRCLGPHNHKDMTLVLLLCLPRKSCKEFPQFPCRGPFFKGDCWRKLTNTGECIRFCTCPRLRSLISSRVLTCRNVARSVDHDGCNLPITAC